MNPHNFPSRMKIGKNEIPENKVQGEILEDLGSLIDTSEGGDITLGFVKRVLAKNL